MLEILTIITMILTLFLIIIVISNLHKNQAQKDIITIRKTKIHNYPEFKEKETT